MNGTIHPQKRSSLRKKVFKSDFSVFGRFCTHSDLFVFHLVGGFETLASEFAAGTIFAAVIVRGGNRSVFLFGTGTSKEKLSSTCAKKTILMLQRLHMRSIFQPAVLAAKGEIVFHLIAQHKLCVFKWLIVQQPAQFCPLWQYSSRFPRARLHPSKS